MLLTNPHYITACIQTKKETGKHRERERERERERGGGNERQ